MIEGKTEDRTFTELHSDRAPVPTLVPGRSGPLVHSSGPETGSQKELGHCSRHRHPGHRSSGDDKDDVLCRYFYSCAKYFSMVAYHESGLWSCSKVTS